MKRYLAAAAAIVLLSATAAQAEKKILTFGLGQADAKRLDPHVTATSGDKILLSSIFNGLVRIQPGKANPEFIEPDLAESWSASPDGKEWMFQLRKGVQCHHGYGELTSDDVVYSLKRAATEETSSFSSDFQSFDKIEAVDKYSVKIVLENQIPSVLGILTNYHGGNIVCKKAAEEMGDNFNQRPIGTGPFMFEEYKPQESVTLVANPEYFRGKPKLDRIVYRYIPPAASRELAFMSGEIDIFQGQYEQKWIDRVSKMNDVVVEVTEPVELATLHLNVTVPPLNDIRIRKAIAHAIDREAMLAFSGSALSRRSSSVVPTGYLGHTSDVPLLPHDLKKAKALLAEAGYPNGLTIKTIHSNKESMLKVIEVVQAQLRKAGIDLDIDLVDHSTFHSQIRKDLSPVVHYGAARFPIADIYLTQFYHSRSIVNTPTGVTNFSHCAIADAEIDSARSEPDPEKQMMLWKTAQQKLVSNVCGIPMLEGFWLWVRRNALDLGYTFTGALTGGPMITELTRFK